VLALALFLYKRYIRHLCTLESFLRLVDTKSKKPSYDKNIQGDIIQILDETFKIVVTYKYDAWEIS